MHNTSCATPLPMDLRSAGRVEDWYEQHQRAWARRIGLPIADHNHTATVDLDLFQRLSYGARAQFLKGAGNELDSSNGPADLSSLRSSAALCVNTLHTWTRSPTRALASALGVEGELRNIHLESKAPTGLAGTPPHLDACASTTGGTVVAIEAKFLEPLGNPTRKFRPSHFSDATDWSSLKAVKALATELQRSNHYARLGAVQLIRHILGLRRKLGPRGFVLVHLYYDMDHRFGEDQDADRFGVGHQHGNGAISYIDNGLLLATCTASRGCGEE